jgi:hypothetical protein
MNESWSVEANVLMWDASCNGRHVKRAASLLAPQALQVPRSDALLHYCSFVTAALHIAMW